MSFGSSSGSKNTNGFCKTPTNWSCVTAAFGKSQARFDQGTDTMIALIFFATIFGFELWLVVSVK
jgi:hypothetical protein